MEKMKNALKTLYLKAKTIIHVYRSSKNNN